MLTGENGILKKANQTEDIYGIGQAEEYLKLAKTEVILDKQSPKITLDEYLEFLRNDGRTDSKKVSSTKAYVKVDNKYIFLIEEDDNGSTKITYIEGQDIPIDSAVGIVEFGNLEWNNGKASVKITKNSEDDLKMEYQVLDKNLDEVVSFTEIESGSTLTDLDLDDVVYVRLKEGERHGNSTSLTVEDRTKPSITVSEAGKATNNIAVSVTAVDGESGIDASAKYNYYIKLSTEEDYSTITVEDNNTSYTFTDLLQGMSYDIKVTIEDKAGNIGEGELKGVTTNMVSAAIGAISFGDLIWNEGRASVTITKNTNDTLNIEYRVLDDQLDVLRDYQNVNNGDKISGLNSGETVEIRLTDGKNTGSTATLSVIDATVPNVTVAQTNKSTNSIEITVTATDSETGIDTNTKYNYYIKPTTQANYPTNPTKQTKDTNYTFTGLDDQTSYDIKVTIEDKVGNIGIGELKGITTDEVVSASQDMFSNLTWSEGKASVTVSTTTGLKILYRILDEDLNVVKDYQEINNGSTITGLNSGEIVEIKLTDGKNEGSTATLSVVDATVPNVTVTQRSKNTSSIEISVTATDSETGIDTNAKYNYYIKPATQANYPTTPTKQTIETNYTFTGLDDQTSYDIKVTIEDNVGNIGIGELKGITTDEVVSASQDMFSNLTWSEGKASVTVSTTTGLKILYRILDEDLNVVNDYQEINNGSTITGVNSGEIVEIKLTDGRNEGSTASLTVEDKKAPTVAIATSKAGIDNIPVIVTATDEETGIDKYYYYIKLSTDADYPTKETAQIQTASYTYTGLKDNTSYDIKVIVYDKEGNSNKAEVTGIKTDKISIESLQGKIINPNANTPIEDKYGNTVIVPAGFAITKDASDVTQGLVITDQVDANGNSTGNEFVWIPIGEVKMATGTTTITLAKYVFDSSGGILFTQTGVVTSSSSSSFKPTASSSIKYFDNPNYKDAIQNFIDYAKLYKGYYFGRYEAGDADATASNIPRTAESGTTGKVVVKANQQVYNFIGRDSLAENIRKMYNNENFTSDLINSHAWDTAILFIQNCGTTEYAKKYSIFDGVTADRTLSLTGNQIVKETNEKDMQLNIFDMTCSIQEWVPEGSTSSSERALYRGGSFNTQVSAGPRNRSGYVNGNKLDDDKGGRPILYLTK